jgi:hypothetical protein
LNDLTNDKRFYITVRGESLKLLEALTRTGLLDQRATWEERDGYAILHVRGSNNDFKKLVTLGFKPELE